MLTKIQIIFEKPNDDFSFHSSSLFHGALMQLVDGNFAAEMHSENIRPYSQNITYDNDKIFWTVCTLSENAKSNISDILIDDSFKSIYLEHKDITLKVVEKKVISQITYSDLFKKVYLENNYQNYETYKFYTPTAFKSDGCYINIPNVYLIFNSILTKYDAFSSEIELKDEKLLSEICDRVNISNYKLHSSSFALEGIKIPSFVGEFTVSVHGDERLKKLVSMLLEFSAYSGVGIKTALGMGAVKKQSRKEK